MLGFARPLFHGHMTLCATSFGSVAALTPLEPLLGQIYMAVLGSQITGLHLAFLGPRSPE